ncbi:MAG: signal peptidase II [Firmicutes bacterium]|nr:signal peptidase II [Bacillota bacterium]
MLYAIIAAIILIGDQWLKYWVTVNITLSTGDVALIPGVVKLVNIHNSGAAFGFLSNTEYARWLFLGVAALFIIVIVVVLAKHLFKSRFANWCAVLALAGAVGNCIDRALYGYVVDMFKVEFMDFAVFNIADIFLVVACIAFVIYLIVDIFKGGKDEDDEDDEPEEEKPRRSERRSDAKSERRSERKADAKPERRARKPVTDDEYSVSGIKTGGLEFPDTATPLVSDDKAEDTDDFWASFKSELRSGETSKPAPQPARPKPADEYDLESILAEFRDL